MQVEMRRTNTNLPLPLTTSRLVNKLPRNSPKVPSTLFHKPSSRINTLIHTSQKSKSDAKSEENDVLGELMAKLNEQKINAHDGGVPLDDESSSQNTDTFANTPPAGSTATSDSNDTSMMENMKRALDLANERMAQMELELSQSRIRQNAEQHPIAAPFPAPAPVFPLPSLGGARAVYDGPESKRTSPLDLNSQSQGLGPNGSFQGGTLAPPPFFAGQK